MAVQTPARAPADRRGARPRGRAAPRPPGKAGKAWLFSTPFLLVFGLMYAMPLIAGLVMGFTDMRSTDVRNPLAVNFVGLENYERLFQDEAMRRAATNTLFFVVTTTPLTIAAGLAAAMLLDSGITRLRTFFRLGYYLPYVTSIIGIAVAWRLLLDPQAGLVNDLLRTVGIDGPAWLLDERTALPSLVLMTAWRNFGFDMVVFLAALQSVPRELYEAAQVDGAGTWARFRRITVPMLRPALLFCGVYSAAGFLQFLEEPLVMTRGGPLNSTLSASLAIYNQFGFGNYGYGAAAATVLFTVIAAFSFAQFRWLRPRT
ncbi:sugar ABC transporter permease [Sphaerisporangium sp. TRM90804]|uniref:carbohydrate ABC transporter permease n=1 Tax=Sphaerisporangium sp. TRM90804 TaxID=3031113 RepID=UPI00244D5EE8|nr:sugar ABC transporter permease [Sphaerisporangium sp. TRM90804]MDH2427125.1 sugar ABC transporter permease [Sphaerisporangium sp. TRM90804]